MAEKPRELSDFWGWANLRLNYRLKGYVSRQYNDGGMVILYNFAAGSFYTKRLCSRLYSIEIEFYLKRFLSNP